MGTCLPDVPEILQLVIPVVCNNTKGMQLHRVIIYLQKLFQPLPLWLSKQNLYFDSSHHISVSSDMNRGSNGYTIMEYS